MTASEEIATIVRKRLRELEAEVAKIQAAIKALD